MVKRVAWLSLLLALVVTLGVSLAVSAVTVCEHCQNSAPSGSSVPYYQCKTCYRRYCGQCELLLDGVTVCPMCKSADRYEVGRVDGQSN